MEGIKEVISGNTWYGEIFGLVLCPVKVYSALCCLVLQFSCTDIFVVLLSSMARDEQFTCNLDKIARARLNCSP